MHFINQIKLYSSESTLIVAFQFERGFDAFADYLWETNNKGKLWKDIKHKYITEEWRLSWLTL